eukprot:XP_014776220.1 PREDICTED: uncharacterized protein LOC106873387 [Octopus bimaculoides]
MLRTTGLIVAKDGVASPVFVFNFPDVSPDSKFLLRESGYKNSNSYHKCSRLQTSTVATSSSAVAKTDIKQAIPINLQRQSVLHYIDTPTEEEAIINTTFSFPNGFIEIATSFNFSFCELWIDITMSVIEYVKDIREVIHVDSVNNLHALIVEELRKAGVKIPFGIDQGCMRAPLSHDREIRHFNNYLAHVPCYYLESFGHIPSLLEGNRRGNNLKAPYRTLLRNWDASCYLYDSGLPAQTEDIEQILDVSSANVFDVTGLIKQFFRELKEPLLTNVYHTAFLKCQQMRDNGSIEKGRRAALKLCLLIPPEHLGTLKFTMNLFHKVAAHSAQNKMTARNLALIMAPSIMHNCPKGNKMSGQEEKWLPLKTSLLEMLINEHENIGLVSIELCDQAKEMANFFNKLSPYKYDDIAEGRITPFTNENNSTTAVTKKKQHQRRSGSLQDFMSNIC